MNRYDLAIIGGGINGVAIARDASLRGLKVILFEKEDFGSGASTKSSKLAHGGLRYLEQFQWGLVHHCLLERNLLLKNAPHLVKPLPFVYPSYKNNPVPLWKLRMGLYLYDFLAAPSPMPRHRFLNTQAMTEIFPNIRQEGLKGGCHYFDAQMEDNRLVIENMLSAQEHGAQLFNYTEVIALKKNDGKVNGLVCNDGQEILADKVVNTTGAWSSKIFEMDDYTPPYEVSPTKGVHLVIPAIVKDTALILTAPQDKRVFFLLPWHGYNLLGTTDTFFDGNPDGVSVTDEDISYLITALQHYFPTLPGTIHASFAGLRPLYQFSKKNASDVSRDHIIDEAPSGLITLIGGKYTTYRQMAEETVNKVTGKKGSPTLHAPLYGAVPRENMETNIDPLQVPRLKKVYGTAYVDVLKIIENDPSQAQLICEEHPHMMAELTYSIQVEKAKTVEDWLYRRTSIGYSECQGMKCLERTEQKFKIGLTLRDTPSVRDISR